MPHGRPFGIHGIVGVPSKRFAHQLFIRNVFFPNAFVVAVLRRGVVKHVFHGTIHDVEKLFLIEVAELRQHEVGEHGVLVHHNHDLVGRSGDLTARARNDVVLRKDKVAVVGRHGKAIAHHADIGGKFLVVLYIAQHFGIRLRGRRYRHFARRKLPVFALERIVGI